MSAGMTKGQYEGLMEILVGYEDLTAENSALRALLKTVTKFGSFGQSNWEAELEKLMSGPTRDESRKLFVPILKEISSTFWDAEFGRQLAQSPLRGLIN